MSILANTGSSVKGKKKDKMKSAISAKREREKPLQMKTMPALPAKLMVKLSSLGCHCWKGTHRLQIFITEDNINKI